MAGTISVYDTVAQAKTVLLENRRPELLQQRYFGTEEPLDLFEGEEVLFDLDQGDLKSGAFVKCGYVDGNTTTMFSNAVEPPRIGAKDSINLCSSRDRVIFEQLCRAQGVLNPSHADALEALLRIKALRVSNRAARSIERLCSMLLQNNAIQFQMDTSPTDSTPVTIDVEYFDSTGGATNPQIYTPVKDWWKIYDNTENPDDPKNGQEVPVEGSTPYLDVCGMVRTLVQNGGRAEDLLMSEKMWGYLYADMQSKGLLNSQIHYTIMANGDVKDLFSAEIEDAKCVGQAQFNGHVLNLIVYNGAYKAANGTMTNYLPDNFVCVLAPGCGHTICGAVTLPNLAGMLTDGSPSVVQKVGKFIVSKVVDPYTGVVEVRCESRPLPAPYHVWGWITLGPAPEDGD